MPQFPRHESERQLTTQQPSFLAAGDTKAQRLGVLAETAGALQQEVYDVTKSWQAGVSAIQETYAKANFKSGMMDIMRQAEDDPDANNFQKYAQEINKLREASLKGIRSPETKTKAALDLGLEAKAGSIELDRLFKKKFIAEGMAGLSKFIDTHVNDPTDDSLSKIKEELDRNVTARVIAPDDAYRMLSKANEDLGISRVNKALYLSETPEDAQAVRAAIIAGDFERGGVSIDPEKKRALLDVADRVEANAKKKLEAQRAEEITKMRVETITGIASGAIDPRTIDITEITRNDPKLGAAITKVKEFLTNYNPKIPLEEQRVSMAGQLTASKLLEARQYAKSVSDVFMNNDNEQLGEFVLRELNDKADGKNQSVRLAAFMQLAALKFKANNPESQDSAQAIDHLRSIKSAIRFLETENPYLAPPLVGDLLVKIFLGRNKSASGAMKEANNLLKEKLMDRYKGLSRLPSVPNYVTGGEETVAELHSGADVDEDGNYVGNSESMANYDEPGSASE